MNKGSVGLVVTWIVLVLIGLSLISQFQQWHFENHLEKLMGEIAENEDQSRELEEMWESLDKGDPSEICYYCRLGTTHYCDTYRYDFYEYLMKKEKGNFLIGTFLTQADEGAFLEGVLIIRVSYPAVSSGRYADDEYCEILSDYSQRCEGSNQVFNWEEFKSSDEYREHIDELYHSLENVEEISLQDTYEQIKNLEETALRDPYRTALLQSYVFLAETAYTNYQMHRNQDEFMKAVTDAEIVYSVHGFSRHLETKETVFTTLTPFRRGDIYVHSAIRDLVIVLTLSMFLAVILWDVIRQKNLV